jgi:UDP-N-acetylglucosamine 2-epimerase (non-hydrolysing)
MHKILFILGTRPEAIKLSPVLHHLRKRSHEFSVRLCVTAQHRFMLDQVLAAFNLVPDYDLDLMQESQTLAQSTARIMAGLEAVLQAEQPDMVLVQGDTTTTFCGALSAFYQQLAVGHVEAGLRTGDARAPFPEEMNRVLTTRISSLHFAPTELAARNLENEGVARSRIHVTGNSGIDALLHVKDALEAGSLQGAAWNQIDSLKKLILVTAHRRENFGQNLEAICAALLQISRRDDVQIVYPVHRNPNVLNPVTRLLGSQQNIFLVEPLGYVPFIDLMRRAYLLISDSGGVQEEAPALGKPVLVLRGASERPEVVEAGTGILVGADCGRIVSQTVQLLENAGEYARRSHVYYPYGDGQASCRIGDAIRSFFTSA